MLHDYTYIIQYGNTYSHVSKNMYDTYVTLLITKYENKLIEYNIYSGYDKAIICKVTMDKIIDHKKYQALVMPYDVFQNEFSEEEQKQKLNKDFTNKWE